MPFHNVHTSQQKYMLPRGVQNVSTAANCPWVQNGTKILLGLRVMRTQTRSTSLKALRVLSTTSGVLQSKRPTITKSTKQQNVVSRHSALGMHSCRGSNGAGKNVGASEYLNIEMTNTQIEHRSSWDGRYRAVSRREFRLVAAEGERWDGQPSQRLTTFYLTLTPFWLKCFYCVYSFVEASF